MKGEFIAGYFTPVSRPGMPGWKPEHPWVPGEPGEPGEPEAPNEGGEVSPPIAGVPPWWGKPLPPLPEVPPMPPGWEPPTVPPGWERPPLPPILGKPTHPIEIPVYPEQPLPPGTVWPPFNPSDALHGKMLLLCWVPGAGLKWIVVKLPEWTPPAGGIGGTPPQRPGGGIPERGVEEFPNANPSGDLLGGNAVRAATPKAR